MILFLRRRLTDSRKKTFRKQQPKRKKRPVTRMTNPTTRTNLYDAVVENINGGLAKVAELLGRNEAERATAAVPAGTGDTSEEHEAFDMNDFL